MAVNEVVVTEETLPEHHPANKTYNLLLIGADRRDASWNGNSDAMILITINEGKKTLTMTSFMRDLYANIEGVGVRKLNHSYAVGGGPKLVKTLQDNYGVKIDNYASVDFAGLAAVIDTLGGVTITVKDYELPTMRIVGIPEAGTYRLNGNQTLTYTRIRYQGRSDFERTQRQRVVLQALMADARQMSVAKMNEMANAVLPYVTHNIDQGTMLTLLSKLPSYLNYEVTEIRIPEDGTWTSQGEILVPKVINAVIRSLRDRLYGE